MVVSREWVLWRLGAPAVIVALAVGATVNISSGWRAAVDDRRVNASKVHLIEDMERLRFYDEALTTNARLATATGDAEYVRRYRALEPQLDTVLADARSRAPGDGLRRQVDATFAVNEELVALERAALAELAAGRRAQGYALVTSPRYNLLKQQYQAHVQQGAGAVSADLHAHAENAFSRQVSALAGGAGSALITVLSVSFALVGWRRSRRNHLRDEARSAAILNTATVSFVELDAAGRIVSCNRRAQQATGWSLEQTRDRALLDLAAPVGNPDRDRWAALIETVLAGAEATEREVHTTLRDGRNVLTDVSMWPSNDGQGRVNVFVSDVTERATLMDRLRSQALTDPLTAMANRRALTEHLSAATGQDTALLMIDLDEFKVLNDAYGHGAGDLLLHAAARRISTTVTTLITHDDGAGAVPGVLCARLGGDEFAVLLTGRHAAVAERVADGLIAALAQPVEVPGTAGGVVLTASIGLSRHRCEQGPDGDAGALLAEADLALYAAKAAGRARWVTYDSALRDIAVDRATVEHDLRTGLPAGELIPHFQPVIRLGDGVVVGVEALARWQHPTRGMLAPAAFIDVAERSDLIIDVGVSMLAQTCAQLAAWDIELGPAAPGYAAVNLSARHLGRQHLAADIAALLRAHDLLPHRLVLEITEAAIIEDTTVATTNLHDLADMGVRLAIDDFGTGHSSLARLGALPVHILKIDRSFVTTIGADGAPLVELTLGLAASLGLDVVAEGVETTAQHDYLTARGCSNAQGFHYARPGTTPEISHLCREQAPIVLAGAALAATAHQ